MKKSLIFVITQILIVLVNTICPNNCSGHGKCVNSVCECEKNVGVLSSGSSFKTYSWVGADCSKKSCGVDIPFSAVSNENDYSNRLVDDGLMPLRELSPNELKLRSLSSDLSVSNPTQIKGTSFYEVTLGSTDIITAIGGLLYYYNEKNEYLGKCELFCNSDKSKCFMKFEDVDVVYTPESYSYIVILEYSDYSLIYEKLDTTAEFTFVWNKMGYIMSTLGIEKYNFECGETPAEFSASIPSGASKEDPKDITFTAKETKTGCSLLGDSETIPSDRTKIKAVTTDVTDAKLNIEGKEMKIWKIVDSKNYLSIPEKIGVLECITPESKSSKAYLMNVETTTAPSETYYIAYDFILSGSPEVTKPNPTEYKCERVIEYEDLSYYFPASSTTGDSCTITWTGMKDVIQADSLIVGVDSTNPFTFACKDDKDIVRVYDGFTYSFDTEMKFTKSGCGITSGTYTCFILAEIDESSKKITPLESISGSYLEKYHLTISKPTGILTYKTAKELDSVNKIYEMAGGKYNVGPSGGTLECYKSDGKSKYTARILRKKGDIIIVKSSSEITTSTDNPDICNMTIKHSDLSLFNPVTLTAEGKIVWDGINDYLDGTNFLKSINTQYQFACKSSDIINIRTTTRTINEKNIEFECTDCVEGETCYLLSYSDGSAIKDIMESDLTKIFKLEKNADGSGYNIKIDKITFTVVDNKKITTPVSGTDKPIYKMSGVKYELGKSGGLLSCFKEDDTFVSLVQIIGMKDENTYSVAASETIANPSETGIDHCDVIMKMNDLSTINELTLSCTGTEVNSVCTLTYPNSELDLFDKQFISLRKASSKFICGKKANGNEFKKYEFTSSDTPLTFTHTKKTGETLATGDTCYLASDIDGKDVEITASDIFKLQLDKDNTVINSANDISEDSKSIYKVKGVNYDIGKFGGEIACGTTKATIIGVIDDVYYISYGKAKDIDLRGCKVIRKYNDLSLYTATSASSPYLLKSYLPSTSSINFICKGDNNKLTTTTSTVTTAAVGSTEIVSTSFGSGFPAADNTCSMLYGENGNIELKDSDYRYEYLIDNPSEWKYSENGVIDEEVKTVNVEEVKSLKSIVNEIPEIGGTLKCYDSKGELLGQAVVYSNINGELNIEYKFPMKPDIKMEDVQFEVISKNEDLSTNSIKVKEESCKNANNCEIIWKGVGLLLISKGFFDDFDNTQLSLMRLLSPTYLKLPCANPKDGKISNFTFISEIVGNDVVLSDPQPTIPAAGSECFPLFNSEAKPIGISESVIGKSIVVDENNNMIMPSVIKGEEGSDGIKDGIISEVSKNVNNEYVINIKKYTNVDITTKQNSLGMLLISPIEDNDLFNEVKQFLSIGSWLSIMKDSTLVQSQILNLDYNIEVSEAPRQRMRQLAATYTFWGLKLSNFDSIQCSSGSTCSYSISRSTTMSNIHKRIECSGQGICNRESGMCECFDGFSGSYCQRMSCPNNCNGNGRCVPLSELLNNDEMNEYNKELDKNRVYGCLCDKRHRGYDCSLIECPSDKDPEGGTNDKVNGLEEYRDCSGRGICDYKTGICECFDGFSGEGCQNQVGTI